MHTQGRKAALFASKALTKSSHKQEALLKSKATSTHVRTHRSIAACVGSPEPGGCVAGCRVATGLSAAGRRLFWGEIPLASYSYFCQPACTGLERVTVPATLQASDSLGMRDWGASAVNLGRNTHVQQQYWSNQKTLQVDYTFICFCPSPVKINTHIPKVKSFCDLTCWDPSNLPTSQFILKPTVYFGLFKPALIFHFTQTMIVRDRA